MTFDGIIEALGGRLGAEIENAGGAAAVEIDGAVVVLQDVGEFLLLRAEIGELPDEGRDALVASAMKANFLYQGRGRAAPRSRSTRTPAGSSSRSTTGWSVSTRNRPSTCSSASRTRWPPGSASSPTTVPSPKPPSRNRHPSAPSRSCRCDRSTANSLIHFQTAELKRERNSQQHSETVIGGKPPWSHAMGGPRSVAAEKVGRSPRDRRPPMKPR